MQTTIKTKTKITIVVLAVAVAVTTLYLYKHHRDQEKLAYKPPVKPTVVLFSTAKAQTWQQQIRAIGTVTAMQGITVRAEVNGYIAKIYYPSGGIVSKDAALFQVNPKILEAAVKQDQANLALAKFEYERQLELYKKNDVSLEELTKAKSNLAALQAKLTSSQQQLSLTINYAPFAGILGLKKVDLGDYVQEGTPLATLQALDRLRVDFSIPEKYAADVKTKDEVIVISPHHPKVPISGYVYAINPLIHKDSRKLDLRAYIKTKKLLPGAFVNVYLQLPESENVIVIPQTAVIKSLHGDYVYKVEKGKAKKVVVIPGQRRGSVIAITSGLKAGDIVVSAGQLKLHDGALVTNKDTIMVKQSNKKENEH